MKSSHKGLLFSMEASYIPHALPSQTVFDFLSQRHGRLPFHFGHYGLFFGWGRPATNQSA